MCRLRFNLSWSLIYCGRKLVWIQDLWEVWKFFFPGKKMEKVYWPLEKLPLTILAAEVNYFLSQRLSLQCGDVSASHGTTYNRFGASRRVVGKFWLSDMVWRWSGLKWMQIKRLRLPKWAERFGSFSRLRRSVAYLVGQENPPSTQASNDQFACHGVKPDPLMVDGTVKRRIFPKFAILSAQSNEFGYDYLRFKKVFSCTNAVQVNDFI